MTQYPLDEMLSTIQGQLYQRSDRICTGHSIDTRTIVPNDLYWALKGERFDGHDFINEAWAKGAAAVVVSRHPRQYKGTYILVKDTLDALQSYAGYYRKKFRIPIIGITGSHGKTTTKDMLASVLQTTFSTHKTHLNLNGLIGVPLTLLGISEDTEIAVVEIGISKPGEMRLLSSITKPTVGLLTGIAETHTEYLSDIENIFMEKSLLFKNLFDENSLRVLNRDDTFAARLIVSKNCITYGFENGDYRSKIISLKPTESSFVITEPSSRETHYTISLPGHHNILNATAAIAVARYFNISPIDIQHGLKNIALSPYRSQIHHINSIIIINDAYNAAPRSMLISLKMLKDISGNLYRSIAILGDMLELGEHSRNAHEKLGHHIKSLEIDMVICFGDEIRHTYTVLKSDEYPAYYFSTKDDVIFFCETHIKDKDCILVKASRGLHAEEISDSLIYYLKTRRKRG